MASNGKREKRTNGDTLGVNGAKVGIFEQGDEVGFSSFLKGQNGGRLEAKIVLINKNTRVRQKRKSTAFRTTAIEIKQTKRRKEQQRVVEGIRIEEGENKP
jgi:hypothetical protein